jgi:hypothetical protein
MILQPSKNQSVLSKLSTVGIALLVILGLSEVTFGLLGFLGQPDGYNPVWRFFTAIIMAPLWEELAWRVAPIKFAKALSPLLVWPVVLLSSIHFGLGHSSMYYPMQYALLIQGVGGFILSWVYIKNNYSYWPNVLLHALINFMIIYVLN